MDGGAPPPRRTVRPEARAASDRPRASARERLPCLSVSPFRQPPSKLITASGIAWIPRVGTRAPACVPAPAQLVAAMPNPLPFPPEKLALIGLVLALAGCQPGSNSHPVPSVPQMGRDLKCTNGDHPYEDPQAGWGFCYPDGWKYTERSQGSQSPPGLDLTFDITYVPANRLPCPSLAAGSGPPASPRSGDFA